MHAESGGRMGDNYRVILVLTGNSRQRPCISLSLSPVMRAKPIIEIRNAHKLIFLRGMERERFRFEVPFFSPKEKKRAENCLSSSRGVAKLTDDGGARMIWRRARLGHHWKSEKMNTFVLGTRCMLRANCDRIPQLNG